MDRLSYWAYRLISAAAGLLPLPLLCRLGMVCGWGAYYLLPGYRRLALRNLAIAFSGPHESAPLTRRELRALARKHFATLGANLLGSIGVARLSADDVRKVATIDGHEIPLELIEQKRGFVFVIAHLGNWELLSQLTPLLYEVPTGTVYQRLGNPYMDADVRAARARLGLHLFERKEGFQAAIKMLREGGGVGVLADQHAGDAGVWAPFFGRLASTTSLPAMMALRANAALLPITIQTVRPGQWRWIIGESIEVNSRDPNEATAIINLNIEKRIRDAPADWFWVHNRWKTPKPKFLLASYKRGIVEPLDGRPLQPFRILIRSTNWLGDAVMSVPAVRAIKAGRPDTHVTILAPAKLAQIWQAVPEVDEVIAIEKRDGVFGVARRICGKFDVAILFPNSVRSALEAWLAGIPRRVGYPGHRRAWLLNQPFREKKKKSVASEPPRHQVEHYLRLAEFVGAEIDGWSLAEPRPPATEAVARIAVCPGAEYGPAKRWPAERFAKVIQQVSAGRACEWCLVGVEKDAPIAEEIARASGVSVRNLAGKTSLAELMTLLRTCTLLLTNDTGTMHLAALLGVPVVAIFGSTEPALTGPLGEGHRVLRHHVDCSPCFLRECPIDFRCMKAIEPPEVVAAIEGMLESSRSPA
jgi:lipopolysaccharide heptosyltransferase II